jgi:hypothetical protein
MQVYAVYFHRVSYQNGGYQTDIYIYKEKDKAIDKANELHDNWSYHRYDLNDKYYDEEEKEWVKKSEDVCYISGNTERYNECDLDKASIRIEDETLNLDNDLLLHFDVRS